jgi:hypothetical protein
MNNYFLAFLSIRRPSNGQSVRGTFFPSEKDIYRVKGVRVSHTILTIAMRVDITILTLKGALCDCLACLRPL